MSARYALATAPTDLLEHDFTEQVIGTKARPGIVRVLGWEQYHVFYSKRSAKGWPDWMLVRDRLVALELKTMQGKVSAEQKQWIAKLLAAGVEAYVIRPSDLDDLACVLAARRREQTGLLSTVEACESRAVLLAQTRSEIE